MQPHSACALALGHYIFNVKKDPGKEVSFSMQCQLPEKKPRTLKYTVRNVTIIRDKDTGQISGFSGNFDRSGDSLTCTIELKVSAGYVQYGSQMRFKHSTNHSSGFYEYVRWADKEIKGRHSGSLRYGDFVAKVVSEKQVRVIGSYLKKPGKIEFDIRMN